MNTAREFLETLESLKKDKSVYNAHCQEVAKVVVPRLDTFYRQNIMAGEKRTQHMFDSTAPLALERFSSIINSLVTPRGELWHGLGPMNDELMEDHETMLWYERVQKYLFKLRYSRDSNFSTQMSECYSSMGAFGTGVLIVEERIGRWARYKSSHIKEHHFMENADGIIDTNYREYPLTAKQAAEKFGSDNLPIQIQNALEKDPTQKFMFLHVVRPNTERKMGVVTADGMAFESWHISCTGSQMVAPRGGFRKFPFIVSRYITSVDEIYGRSPAMTALAEIKMLNQMRKTDLRARHLAVDAPILASNEASLGKVSLKPNGITYGALDMNGNPLIRPWQTGNSLNASESGIEQSRKIINDIFLVNLFQILIDTPEMTATEVMARQREKADLLSPVSGNLESETLYNLIDREIDMMASAGLFDADGPLPMPDAVRERNGEYDISFTSPMARMRLAGEAAGAERTVQALIPAAQIKPDVLDGINWDSYAKIMKRANGAPESMFFSDEVVASMRQQKAQQQQMEQLAQAAPQVAGAVKDLAQARSYE